jgi:hypothetical protein
MPRPLDSNYGISSPWCRPLIRVTTSTSSSAKFHEVHIRTHVPQIAVRRLRILLATHVVAHTGPSSDHRSRPNWSRSVFILNCSSPTNGKLYLSSRSAPLITALQSPICNIELLDPFVVDASPTDIRFTVSKVTIPTVPVILAVYLSPPLCMRLLDSLCAIAG